MVRVISSVSDLTKNEILKLISDLDLISESKDAENSFFTENAEVLKGKILLTLFLSPSTRTRTSFVSSFMRMGGNVMNYSTVTETNAGESGAEEWDDTGAYLSQYVDLITLRTGNADIFTKLAQGVSVPLVSAGHGEVEHPTTALNYLHTIYKEVGRLDNLNCVFLAKMPKRCIHSLINGLLMWPNQTIDILGSGNVVNYEMFNILAGENGSQIKHKQSATDEEMWEKINNADLVFMDEGKRDYATHNEPFIQINKQQLAQIQKNSLFIHGKPVLKLLDKQAATGIRDFLIEQSHKSYLCRSLIMKKLLLDDIHGVQI